MEIIIEDFLKYIAQFKLVGFPVLIPLIPLTFFIVSSTLLYKYFVYIAVKGHIKPYFNKLGYTINKVKFPGILNAGDFKEKDNWNIGGPVSKYGSPVNWTYTYLYLTDNSGNNQIRITAKIKSVFFWIKKVEYSKSLPDISSSKTSL